MNPVDTIMKVNLDGTAFNPLAMASSQGVVESLFQRNGVEPVLGDNINSLEDVVGLAKSYFSFAKNLIGANSLRDNDDNENRHSDAISAGIFETMDKVIVPFHKMGKKKILEQSGGMDSDLGASMI